MKVQVQCMDELPCYDSSANRSFEDEHDVAADGEEVNYLTSDHDIMAEVTDPTRCCLSDDQSDRADENRTGSGFEKEKRLSSDISDILASTSYMDDHVDAGLFQMPTENGCSLDEERTLEAGAPSQQLTTDEKDEFVLNEWPTWEAYAFTKQHTNSYDLHDSPVARRSASLSSAHGSVIYVEDFSAGGRTKLPTGNKTTRARKVIPSTADIEVIDIMTPSPDCRVSLFGKNRKAPSVYPSVIDLTRSPNFIQL
uniref:Uncharacterized protein n=1 Tax=Kalanchoe fedtschenkoi TaxID=63787 RepID=A0A7N0VL24_KALFE